jgi:hypothetical protein
VVTCINIYPYQEEKLGIVSNRKLEGIRIREVEGHGGIRRKSAQTRETTKRKKDRREDANNGLSGEGEREEDAHQALLLISHIFPSLTH